MQMEPPDAALTLRINEIYVDRDLSGDRVEFVELIGPAGDSLAGMHLRLIGEEGDVRYDVPVTTENASVGANGLWTVGGSVVTNVDERVGLASWGLDNTAGAVQLVTSENVLLDVVGYGAHVNAPPTPPTATSEGSVPPLTSGAGRSVGRTGARDTGDNARDFCEQAMTPGAANGPCL